MDIFFHVIPPFSHLNPLPSTLPPSSARHARVLTPPPSKHSPTCHLPVTFLPPTCHLSYRSACALPHPPAPPLSSFPPAGSRYVRYPGLYPAPLCHVLRTSGRSSLSLSSFRPTLSLPKGFVIKNHQCPLKNIELFFDILKISFFRDKFARTDWMEHCFLDFSLRAFYS